MVSENTCHFLNHVCYSPSPRSRMGPDLSLRFLKLQLWMLTSQGQQTWMCKENIKEKHHWKPPINLLTVVSGKPCGKRQATCLCELVPRTPSKASREGASQNLLVGV
jgi:hypothetical protein